MKPLTVNIVGRIDGNTGISQHTKAFSNCLRESFNVNFLDTRPETSDNRFLPTGIDCRNPADDEALNADLSIFVDVTSNGPSDENWRKAPATRRKYIYSVFDSTRIPLSWADIINNHFDAVFVPSRFLVDVYRESCVQKPIFVLPLALDLKKFLPVQPTPAKSRPFVFAFVGSREKRKNLDLLINSFHEVFADSPDVELRIHCAIDFFNDGNFGDRLNTRYKNIYYTEGVLNEDEYLAFIEATDCFVSLSKGEGYSIVPRQFLAAGKPVILSDCFAHAEILADLSALGHNLAFAVDASIPSPGLYDHINGGDVFGLQYDCYPPSISTTLYSVFTARSELFTERLIRLRKEWASQFDYKNLSALYKSIVQPAFCRMSTGNALEFGGITTSDANLAARITGRNFSLSGWQNIGPDTRKVVVIGNDGGFFSVLNRFVSYLTWTLSENPTSVVLPDWSIASMQKHWRTEKFTSFCYGRPEDGNIWLKLFKPLPFPEVGEVDYNDAAALNANSELKDDYNEENEPWLTYVHPYKLYRSPGFQRWRHWYHLYFSAYVHLRDDLQRRIDSIYAAQLKGYRVVSAHIRHPSHGIEQPGARMPTVDLYCEMIREIQGREGLNANNSRVFLATDQDSVVDRLRAEFGNMLVYATEAARTSKAADAHFQGLSEKEKMREGFQIQHITAANPKNWSVTMAEEVLIDTFLLAKGEYFVHVTSNIATAVSYINPRIKMIYCE